MNSEFIEFKKIISRAFANMVDDEVISEWQAGYFFALLLCYYNEKCDSDDVFCYEDNFANHKYKKGDYDGIKS